jgi:hypothetical protein
MGKLTIKWQFSIAMLNYEGVHLIFAEAQKWDHVRVVKELIALQPKLVEKNKEVG